MVDPAYLIVGPMDVYLGADSATQPTYVTTAPSGGTWTLIGTLGKLEQDENGLKVSHPQKIDLFRGQDSAPRAAFRTEEDFMAEFAVADVDINNYAWAMNTQSVSSVSASSGVPGSKTMQLYRGPGKLTPVALLCRGTSPNFAGGTAEYYVPRVVQEGPIEPVYTKTGVVLYKFTFRAIAAAAGGSTSFGNFRVQTAAAL